MDNVYVYLIDMPEHVRESVLPCADGYTVYIDRNLCESEQRKAYLHALSHIENRDFENGDVNQIEYEAHRMP